MELQKLRALVALAQSASYTEAAGRLYTTQSNVSKQILSLERELGVRLVERSRRGVALTPAGETAVRGAQKILDEYDAMCRALRTDSGQLTLACIPIVAHYGVTGLFSGFQRAYPALRLAVEEREDSNLLDAVRSGAWEAAVCRTDQDCSGLEKLVLCRDRMVAALPAGHPLAREEAVSLTQLQQEEFLQLGPTSTLYQTVLDICRAAGFTPRITYTSTRMETLLELVREGNGVSLMMARAAAYLPIAGVVLRPLREEVVSELSLVRAAARRRSLAASRPWTYAAGWVRRQEEGAAGER